MCHSDKIQIKRILKETFRVKNYYEYIFHMEGFLHVKSDFLGKHTQLLVKFNKMQMKRL